MSDVLKDGNVSNCRHFTQYIWSYEQDGKQNMVFAGYPTDPTTDYMIYPAASDSRRTFAFDIDASAIGAHTLSAFGFLLNAGIDAQGNLKGYALVIDGYGSSSNQYNGWIKSIDGINAKNTPASGSNCAFYGGSNVSSMFTTGIKASSTKKARLTVDLQKTKVTVQIQHYNAAGVLSEAQTLVKDLTLNDSGYNGFGPFAGYYSHNCQELTVMRFLDLEMNYESTAFDALKNVQYYQKADYKYFINLVGDSNDPAIPVETDPTYADGINRMNENRIFYLSNAQDGKIVTDSKPEEEHLGLGATNGLIALDDDYVAQMAAFIAKNYREGNTFTQASIDSDLPLANFYVVDENDEQVMTIHQQHLKLDGTTITVGFHDESIEGNLAKAHAADNGVKAEIIGWKGAIYGPNNELLAGNDDFVDDPSKLPKYTFDGNGAHDRYTFELTVVDQANNPSKISQTYLTAFLDDDAPLISGLNIQQNKALISMRDTGQGIDTDGITFIEENRGSGINAYYLGTSATDEPQEDDWIYLDEATYVYDLELEFDSTDRVYVWAKDECRNPALLKEFQPVHIIVQDGDGNELHDYYVLEDPDAPHIPIGVLPMPEEVGLPEHSDEEGDERFSGWVYISGNDAPQSLTPETPTPSGGDTHTVIIRPTYDRREATMVYLGNAGQVVTAAGSVDQTSYEVPANSSLAQKVADHNLVAERTGYTFMGWKLLDSNDANNAANASYIASADHVQAITTQLATTGDYASEDDPTYTKTTWYLVAQWEPAKHSLIFDANGGSIGLTRRIDNIPYGTDLKTGLDGKGDLSADEQSQVVPTSGRTLPTRAGYIFQGWSFTPADDGDVRSLYYAASGAAVADTEAHTMPDSDVTLYAVWKQDTAQFVVSFDSDGGSRVNNKAYKKNPGANDANAYADEPTTSKPGYDFGGWYRLDENGALTDERYEAQKTFTDTDKVDHTFKATWMPRADTAYTVNYYINSGELNSDGSYRYTRVTSLTKTNVGTTKSEVTIPAADQLANITVGGKQYWLNLDNPATKLQGTITGNPQLELSLYYDRYFDVTVTKDSTSTGSGTMQSALGQKEGTYPKVTWQADANSYVSKVIVDGNVRDDLITKGSYTVTSPLDHDVAVRVVFTQKSAPTAEPEKPKPPVTQETYHRIEAIVEGTSDPTHITITPTHSVKNGQDTSVSWELAANSRYTVSSVLVDGIEVDTALTNVDFSSVTSDHRVVVKLKALPSLGSTDVQTIDKYTLTVNRYGGDNNVKVSGSMTLNEGEKASVSWDATKSDYVVSKVIFDGFDLTELLVSKNLDQKKPVGQYTGALTALQKMTANHVVDIYFAKPQPATPQPSTPEPGAPNPGTPDPGTPDPGTPDPGTPDPGEPAPPVIPDYTDPSEYIRITTKIVGAEGDINATITGGAVLEKNSLDEYNVDWSLTSKQKAPLGLLKDVDGEVLVPGTDGYYYAPAGDRDEGYICYELEKVVVNGQEVAKPEAEGQISVGTESDKVVEVHVRPVVHTITLLKRGRGDVSPSKSVYHYGNYRNLVSDPAEGWHLYEIQIDDEIWFTNDGLVWTEAGESGGFTEVTDPNAQADLNANIQRAPRKNAVASRAPIVELNDGDSDEEADVPQAPDSVIKLDDALANSGTTLGDVDEGSGVDVSSDLNADVEDDVQDIDVTDGLGGSDEEEYFLSLPSVVVPADTIVSLDGTPVEIPAAAPAYARLGAFAFTNNVYRLGVAQMRTTADPTTNDPSIPDQTAVVVNHVIRVTFVKQAINPETGQPATEPGTDKPLVEPLPEEFYDVYATIVTGEGTVEGSASVGKGDEVTLTVTPDNKYENDYVVELVENGQSVPFTEYTQKADGSLEITVENVDRNRAFEIHLKRKSTSNPNTPIPGEYDLTPKFSITGDTQGGPGAILYLGSVDQGQSRRIEWENLDPDNQRVKYVFIDGKNQPDLLSETSYTFENVQKPYHIVVVFDTNPTNIDTDGDDDPDLDIDMDGDGEPDVDVDTDDDGDPDLNVDPNDDYDPDLNVDIDDNGEPDANIDTNDDGIPDKTWDPEVGTINWIPIFEETGLYPDNYDEVMARLFPVDDKKDPLPYTGPDGEDKEGEDKTDADKTDEDKDSTDPKKRVLPETSDPAISASALMQLVALGGAFVTTGMALRRKQ